METEYVPPAVIKVAGKGKKMKYKCSQCNATYSRKDALQRHALKHTGARPFQCPHCESAFRSSANLIVHVQRKHGTPRHGCNLCQKRFVAPSLLRTHLARAHRTMVSNLKLCSVCQYSSYDLFEFNAHLNSHPPPEAPANKTETNEAGNEGGEVPQDPEVLETIANVEGGEVAVPMPSSAPQPQGGEEAQTVSEQPAQDQAQSETQPSAQPEPQAQAQPESEAQTEKPTQDAPQNGVQSQEQQPTDVVMGEAQ